MRRKKQAGLLNPQQNFSAWVSQQTVTQEEEGHEGSCLSRFYGKSSSQFVYESLYLTGFKKRNHDFLQS